MMPEVRPAGSGRFPEISRVIEILSDFLVIVNMAFLKHRFCIEYGGSGCSSDRIMPHNDHFNIENGTLPDSADNRGHTPVKPDIFDRLGTVPITY